MTAPKDARRCAIYTRKSSEEGLEQEFNSLDAQREACAAYIASQKHEGWVEIETAYDDGGFSGGTMERPGLKQLLNDIEAGHIDVVVVYKVDRLSRALSDFAKMVEIFDTHDVSFVSVTQQFNTTSSMGRLTLNVLLSFAQFEREVTGERIRDKFAASKKKGIWMGGNVPLGFDVVDRKLMVNKPEAETVRHIFRRYLALGNVRKLKSELDDHGFRSKVRTSAKGRVSGGKPFARGALYTILQNKHYIGFITHKDQAYPGDHDAIVDEELWNQVQNLLTKNGINQKHKTCAKEPSLLCGLLFDEHDNRFSPSHAVKNKKRYRYYVNQAYLQNKKAPLNAIKRIPAHEIEKCVIEQLLRVVSEPDTLSAGFNLNGDHTGFPTNHISWDDIQTGWRELEPAHQRKLIHNSVDKIVLRDGSIDIEIAKQGFTQLFNTLSDVQIPQDFGDQTFTRKLKASLKKCRWESKLIIDVPDNQVRSPEFNEALIKTIAQTYAWRQMLLNGEVSSIRQLADAVGSTEKFVSRRLKFAYLSPEIVTAILNGSQPPELTIGRLENGFSKDWEIQKQQLGFA